MTKKKLAEAQDTVIQYALIGVLLAGIIGYIGYYYGSFPCYGGDLFVHKVVLALSYNALVAALILLMVFVVSLGRLFSGAIDPLAGKEDEALRINIRVLNNTFEQAFLFFVTTLSLSVYLEPCCAKLIPIMTYIFLIGRLTYWLGYHRGSSYRAMGYAMSLIYAPFLVYVVYKVMMAYCGCGT